MSNENQNEKGFFIQFPQSLHRRLKGYAGLTGIAMREIVITSLDIYLTELEEEHVRKASQKDKNEIDIKKIIAE